MGFLFQPKGIFIFQYFTAFRLYLFLCQLPFFHSGKHSLHFFLNTPGTSSKSLPLQRLQTDAFIARYPFHGKGIRKDKPLKAEVIHQQTGNYLRESEDGSPFCGSMVGTSKCPTIIPPNPARMAFLKG